MSASTVSSVTSCTIHEKVNGQTARTGFSNYLDNSHGLLLTDAMTAIFSLQIIKRIEVEIMQYARVGGSEIDSYEERTA